MVRRSRWSAALTLLAVVTPTACDEPGRTPPKAPAPPPPESVAAAVTKPPDAFPPSELPPDDLLPALVEETWRHALTGGIEEAQATFELASSKLHDERGTVTTLAGLSGLSDGALYVDDNRTIVVRTAHQRFLVDARSGRIRSERSTRHSTGKHVPIPHQPFFFVSIDDGDPGFDFIDANTGDAIEEASRFTSFASTEDGSQLALVRTKIRENDNDRVALYDVRTRRLRWDLRIERPSGSTPLAGLSFLDRDRVVGVSLTLQRNPSVLLEASTGTLILRAPAMPATPGFSADGRLIAYAGPNDVIKVRERSGEREIGSTRACPKPVGLELDAEGKTLSVTTRDGGCVFAVPSMKLVSTLPKPEPKPEAPAVPTPAVSPLEASGIHIPVCDAGGWVLPVEVCPK